MDVPPPEPVWSRPSVWGRLKKGNRPVGPVPPRPGGGPPRATEPSKVLYFDTPHESPMAAREDRVAELDALRGLAAVAVVIYHAFPSKLPWGWAAVDLFFVLSGYLITSIIVRHGTTPGFLFRFYVRRGLRVWPIYFLTVAALAASSRYMWTPCDWRGLPGVLTFTQNAEQYWAGPIKNYSIYFGHTWTLAIEEQFYLIWPVLILLVGRGRLAALAIACLTTSVLARSCGLGVSVLAARGDGLALGGLLAAILARHRPDGPRRPLLIAIFALTAAISILPLARSEAFTNPNIAFVLAQGPIVTILAFNTLWFGVVGLIVCGSGRPILGLLRLRSLRDLGLISYGLYLYHLPIIILTSQTVWSIGGMARSRPPWINVMMCITCFAVAWSSWVWIERPILSLKDRFSYRRH